MKSVPGVCGTIVYPNIARLEERRWHSECTGLHKSTNIRNDICKIVQEFHPSKDFFLYLYEENRMKHSWHDEGMVTNHLLDERILRPMKPERKCKFLISSIAWYIISISSLFSLKKLTLSASVP